MERLARLTSHFPSNEVDGNRFAVSVHRVSASTPDSGFNVALLGAAGGIGQPLGLLLKMSHMIKELRLYDVVNTAGVAADLSHINTPARTLSFSGQEQLPAALYGAHLVVIPAGVPRKPGMTRDDLFNINAGIVKTLVDGVAKYCPTAWVAIISNPVNSTVPIAAEVLKSHGVYNPRRVFGVTTLDVVRANTFGAEVLGGSTKVEVPVIGGHAGITILPILSAAKPPIILPEEKAKALIARIQDAGTEVVQAKAGAGSATLSMAYAAAEFANSCLRAMGGVTGIIECTYVSSQVTDLPFFASQVVLGQNGIEEYLPLPVMNPVEREAFDKMKSELKASIDKGLAFAARR